MQTPLVFILSALAGGIIALVATVAVNATVANVPDNDLGRDTGWVILTPMPAASIVFSLLDLLLYRFQAFHPIYWLVLSTLFFMAYAGMGGAGIGMYSWDDDGSWVGGMFLIFMAVFYAVSMGFAARAVHYWRQEQSKPCQLKDVEAN